MKEIDYIFDIIKNISLIIPRIYGFFYLLPFINKKTINNKLIFNSIVLSVSLIIYPTIGNNNEEFNFHLIFILIKEFLIGLLLSFIIVIPLWTIEAVGNFIDMQRGATIASTFDPLSGNQASLYAILFNIFYINLVLLSPIFLEILSIFFQSYKIWPILDLSLINQFPDKKILLNLFDYYTLSFLIFSAPIIVPMILVEITMALNNKYTPALNIFILSMPIKSAVAVIFLIGYIYLLSIHILKMYTHLIPIIKNIYLN